ncbi:MAG: ABC transporter permease [Melioribacteraceae bacterium]|nr:ABC transporter permease [Melioribacteraceae bacterium]
MNRLETMKISLNELKANKTKSALTMLGIVFGVASVIAMLSIGEGARQETLEQLELLGTNNILISKRNVDLKSLEANTSFSPGLNIKDAKAIKKINPFVKTVAAQREAEYSVTYKSTITTTKVLGVTSNYIDAYNSKLEKGKFFGEHHSAAYSNVCVIGSDIKNELFKFEDAIGKKIKIEDLWFRIIGVMAHKKSAAGSGIAGARNNNKDIYIPLATMLFKFKSENDAAGNDWRGRLAVVIDRSSVDLLTVKITDDKYIQESADLIKRILARKHYNIADYDVIIPEQIMEQKQKTQRIFNVVMGAIAGISLLVGGIGIMNIMLANILERTKEIGIRRAIGATRVDVLNQFIYEALIISILGGIIGILLGFILTYLISSYADWRTIITPYSVILAFFVSVGVGLGFGSFPAKKAAEKDPIESLRYE